MQCPQYCRRTIGRSLCSINTHIHTHIHSNRTIGMGMTSIALAATATPLRSHYASTGSRHQCTASQYKHMYLISSIFSRQFALIFSLLQKAASGYLKTSVT
eukprot:scpid26277/ scgid26256/ 